MNEKSKTDQTPDAALADLLRRDPLKEVEDLTGVSYKEAEKIPGGNGFILGHAISVNLQKKAALDAVNDTTYSMNVDRYIGIVVEEGFDPCLADTFYSQSSEQMETYYVFWHPDGILLAFDSWNGKVNGGSFYYNWKPKDQDDPCSSWKILSSGSWEEFDDEWIWSGNHDCREALRLHLRELRQEGEFVCPWKIKPFMWLLHHGEDTANKEARLARLPLNARNAIEGI